MVSETDDRTVQLTEHGLMVAWGKFSHHHRLAEQLRQQVTIPRHHENIPAGDLILEFGLLLLSGGTELQNLNQGSHPLVKDKAVKESWDITFGHYTSVSRALKVATAQTVTQVVTVLDTVSRPFLDQEVQALAASGRGLTLYADLSGRPVSDYSESYPEAAWGHMGDSLALGHQHALIALQGQSYRFHLAGFLHPGNTVSQSCLRELVQAAELRLRCRPRRRVELVEAQIASLDARLTYYQNYQQQQDESLRKEQERQQRLDGRLAQLTSTLTLLMVETNDSSDQPYAHRAKLQRQQQSWQSQLEHCQKRQDAIRHKITYHQAQIESLQKQRETLEKWCAQLRADNAANPNPVRIRIKLDGGFSGGDNLAFLIEMGYDLLAVGPKGTAGVILKARPPEAVLTPVTAHVDLWEGSPGPIGTCPYALRRIAQCWQAGEKSRQSSFVLYEDEPALPLAEVFTAYHERQQVEAGIKQGKSVFGGRGVRIRSAAGLELLNQLAFVFWPNFVHWASEWLRTQVQSGIEQLQPVLQTVTTQVQVAAQATAEVITTPGSQVLVFSRNGPYPQVRLLLGGIYSFQYPLPLYQCEVPARFVRTTPRPLLSSPSG